MQRKPIAKFVANLHLAAKFFLFSAVFFSVNFAFADTKELYGIEGPTLQYQTPVMDSTTYRVRGETYTTKTHDDAVDYSKEGMASYYHSKFNGRKTSSGETYNSALYTAAHKTLPLNSYAVVTNLSNNRKVIVKINDRGPFIHQRIIDLSGAAAKELGIINAGSGMVKVESLHVNHKGKVSGAGAKTLAKTTQNPKGIASLDKQVVEQPEDGNSAVQKAQQNVEKPVPQSGQFFKIRLMNFATKQLAQQAVQHLQRTDIEVEIQQNGQQYDLHFGPLSTQEQTNQLKAQLHKLQSKHPLIVYSYHNDEK